MAVQVVGLRGGYHTAAVMGGVNSKVHAKRLAQASEVLIELKGKLHVTHTCQTSPMVMLPHSHQGHGHACKLKASH